MIFKGLANKKNHFYPNYQNQQNKNTIRIGQKLQRIHHNSSQHQKSVAKYSIILQYMRTSNKQWQETGYQQKIIKEEYICLTKHSHRSSLKTLKHSENILIQKVVLKDKKQMIFTYIKTYVCNVAINKKANESDYLLFLVPFSFIMADILSIYQVGERKLILYDVFCQTLKRISSISKVSPFQIDEKQIIDYIVIAVSYKFNNKKIKEALKWFLHKYQMKMKSFIPCYYLYFDMLANRQQRLKDVNSITEAKTMIKGIQDQFQKYNNHQL